MKCNLTKGNVTKTMLLFAVPMILGNLLQQCYTIADTLVVGKCVGSDALGAVGSAYTLMTFLNSVLIGLCMGSGALLSYLAGRGDRIRLKASAQTAFVLIGAVTLALTVAAQCFLHPILQLLRIPVELYEMTRAYVSIVFCGIPFIFLYNYYGFLLRAVGNSVIPLCFLGAASVLNIGLDLFFVLGFHLGLRSTAVATVLAQAVSGVGLGLYVWRAEPFFRFSVREFCHGEKPFRQIGKYSAMTCAQQSVMNFGILLVQSLVNSFGPAVMAAFAAGVKVDTFAYMPAQEFGNAYSIFVSQNYGAGQRTRVRQGTKQAFLVVVAFCTVISGLVFGLASEFIQIFVEKMEGEIIQIGVDYLRVEGAFYIGIGVLFLLYGYFRGINRPGISLVLTGISLGMRVLLAYLLSAMPAFGVTGIWWAIPIGWGLADGVGILLLWLSGRRRQKTLSYCSRW